MTELEEFQGRLINTQLVFPGSRQFKGAYPAVIWSVEQLQGLSHEEIAAQSAKILRDWKDQSPV